MHRQIAGRLTSPVTKWIVLAFWIGAFVVLGGFAGKLTDVQNNEASSWLPQNAESTRALDKMEPFQDPNSIPTTVVYEKADGFSPADLATMKQQATELGQMDDVEGKVIGPIPSRDGQAAQTTVTFNLGANGWNKMPGIAEDIHGIAKVDGASVYIAGAGGQAVDSAESFEGLDSTLLLAALGVVILLLLLTYRSPVLWILPIFSVVVALASSLGLIYFLAKYADLTVNGQSQAIVSILVIGAGTDYALLLVARYREELRRHDDRHEAMAFALHRATPAIIASASTVIVGMLCLTLAEMNSTAGLGPVAAIGVAVTLLAMITLLPALLVIFGRWMFWPKRPSFGSHEPTTTGIWAKVGSWIAPRPRKVWVVTAALLGVACLGVLTLNTNGLSTEDSYTKEFDSVKGQQVLTEHGLADSSTPVMVVANADQAAEVAGAMRGIENLEPPSDPVVQDGVAFITANLTVDSTTTAAFDTVDAVRSAVHAVDGADALVGGQSALYDDMLQANTRDTRVIIPVTLVVVLLILMLLLRAVAVAADPDRHRRAVLRRGAGDQQPGLHLRLRLPGRGPELPVVRVRLPRRPGHRLQHLPDDPGPRGDRPPRHPPGIPGGALGHRRGDHLRRAGPGGHLRRTGLAAAGVPGRARLRGRPGRHPGHDRGALGAGHRDQPRPGQQDLVAELARPR